MNDIYSFYKLISEYKVEIPVIQRDYAQGRTESKATDVRKSIVKSIINTVNGGTRLFFDFVYGRIEGDTFIPFDGQQRLTTLFLFHRYIFEKCKLCTTCQYCNNCQCVSLLSRFSYTTRQSSREFCEQLVCNSILPQSSKVSMSEYIKDQPWFYPEWEKDPTIVGMLTMLDEIDKQCKELPQLNYTEVAQKLTSGCVCPITFHFVNMGEHKMPDSTYIKMNARGKALSSFENFKASLEEYLTVNKKDVIKKRFVGGYDEKQKIQTGVDGIWLDLFYKKTKPNVPDLTMLSFFKRHFLNYYVINGSSDPTTISRLESQLTEDDFVPFEFFETVLKDNEDKVLNPLFNLLDTLYSQYDEVMKGSLPVWYRDDYQSLYDNEYWNLFVGNWNKKGQRSEDNEGEGSERYQSRVAFYAVVKYFDYDTQVAFDSTEFSQWMRVVWNYIENVQYNNFDDYKKDLLLINSLSSGLHKTNDSFYSWLGKQSGSTLSYRQNQLDEEFTKANLIDSNSAVWENHILELEKHKYFTGEIKFMFDFLSNNPSESKFDSYSQVMQELFDENGLKSCYDNNGGYVFRRALMYFSSSYSYGYYKGQNWSFLKNKDRDISWKRFISDSDIVLTGIAHNSILKSLIENIYTQTASGKSIRDAFNSILSYSANVLDWRRLFVESVGVWSYMSDNRYIRYDSDKEIYLLQTTRMSGTHAELRTYYLYDKVNTIKSWVKHYYSVSGREEDPCLYFEKKLSNQIYVIDICWDIDNGIGYYLKLFTRDESQISRFITPIVAKNTTWGLALSDPSNPNSRYESNKMSENDIVNLVNSIMNAI